MPKAAQCIYALAAKQGDNWSWTDADTEKLSDHYPLLTDLDCGEGAVDR